MRTIKLNIPDGFEYVTENHLDGFAFERAIGYLTTWGLSGYPSVWIFPDGSGDMVANYFRTEPELNSYGYPATRPDYQLGAIYDHEAKSYSFHS
jgi:hypothetical protein